MLMNGIRLTLLSRCAFRRNRRYIIRGCTQEICFLEHTLDLSFDYLWRGRSTFILDAAVSGDAIAQVVANNLDDPEPPEMAEGLLANDAEQFQQELPVNTTEGCR